MRPWQRQQRGQWGHLRMRRTTQRLIVGIVVGVLATVAYYAYVEGTLPERLLEFSPVEVALKLPEPPTREEVRQRAERLEAQSLLTGVEAMLCMDGQRLIEEAEADMKRKYPDHYDTSLSDLHRVADTRVAWDILDDVEKLLKDISRACRR